MSTKISQLTSAVDVTANDLIQIVDVEDGVMAPSGTNKKATASLLAKELAKQPLEPGIVISGSSSSNAVRITQTGSGNALVVEDSTNPDSTPFVVDSNGRVIIGDVASRTGPYGFQRGLQITNTSAQLTFASNDQSGNSITFAKSRGTPSSPDVSVQSGDVLGSIAFTANDGGGYVLGSQITSIIDGVAGSGDIPSCLTFGTSTDGTTGLVERMRITSAGNVGIGTSSPTAKLNVVDSSASDAVRITQTGAGNALVVEDSTNPDSTPFVVNPNGKVISGSTLAKTLRNIYTGGQLTPRIQIQGDIGDEACSVIFHSQDNVGSGFTGFARSRGTLAAPEALQNGDYIGVETYQAYDGAEFLEAARIISIIDNDVSIGDVSAAIAFATNAAGTAFGVSERMRITSAGNVGIGTSTPNASCLLDLSSTSRGFRPPSMTTAQRNLIASPVAGVMVYNTTTNKLNFYNGSAWEAVTSAV